MRTINVHSKTIFNNIQLVKVPPNLTHIYQPLDVTVNGTTKQSKKRKFVGWCARQIVTEMNKDRDVEQISVQMKQNP